MSWGQAHASCFLTFPRNSAHAAGLKHSACYMESIDEERFCHASIRATKNRILYCWLTLFICRNDSLRHILQEMVSPYFSIPVNGVSQ